MRRRISEKVIIASAALASVNLGGCVFDSDVEKVRSNAQQVEHSLEGDIKTKKPAELLPGIVAVKNANLRNVPAAFDTNNTAMVDGIPSMHGNFVLFRPFVIRNDDQLNPSSPKYWLGG